RPDIPAAPHEYGHRREYARRHESGLAAAQRCRPRHRPESGPSCPSRREILRASRARETRGGEIDRCPSSAVFAGMTPALSQAPQSRRRMNGSTAQRITAPAASLFGLYGLGVRVGDWLQGLEVDGDRLAVGVSELSGAFHDLAHHRTDEIAVRQLPRTQYANQ